MSAAPPGDGHQVPLAHVPAFDGLRGLAVAAVVLYHLGLPWAGGGFLGVSAFFTLSGFLITRLLLDEHARTGTLDLRSFWVRRARRLLPASLLTIGVVTALGPALASPSQARSLPGDALGALAQVANWRLVLRGAEYGALWEAPSPLQHFWSLAVEEQLYLVLPVAIVGALVVGRRLRASGPRAVLVLLACGTALSVGAGLLAPGSGGGRLYFGTDVRAAEVLIGAAAAALAADVWGRRAVARACSLGGGKVAGLVAGAVVGACGIAWVALESHDPRLARGGFAVHAVAVSVVLLCVQRPGPVTRALSVRPLRALGRVSYGVYLYHWPVVLWATPARLGLGPAATALAQVALTLVLATASLRLLEAPIRAGEWRLPVRPRLALGGAAAGVAALALVTGAWTPPAPAQDWSAATGVLEPRTAASPADAAAPAGTGPAGDVGQPAVVPAAVVPAARPASDPHRRAIEADLRVPGAEVPPPLLLPGERLRLYIGGDSNAFGLGLALREWGEANGVDVWVDGRMACHVVRGGTYRYAGVPKATEEPCNSWAENRIPEIGRIRPHLTLLLFGAFDVLDRQLPGEGWQHVGKRAYDRLAVREIAAMSDAVIAQGTRLAWATYPAFRTGVRDGVAPAVAFPESDPARMDRWNQLLAQAVAARPGSALIDLRSHLQAWPHGELDPAKRPDGLHPTAAVAHDIARWLGPAMVAAARDPSA